MADTVIHHSGQYKTICKLLGRIRSKPGKSNRIRHHHIQTVLQLQQFHLQLPVPFQQFLVNLMQVQIRCYITGNGRNMSCQYVCRTEDDIPLVCIITINQHQRNNLKQNEQEPMPLSYQEVQQFTHK